MSSFYFILFIFLNIMKFLLNILQSFTGKTVSILVLFQIRIPGMHVHPINFSVSYECHPDRSGIGGTQNVWIKLTDLWPGLINDCDHNT